MLVLNKGQSILSGNIEDLRRVDERVYDLRIRGKVERFIAELSERGCSCSLDEKDTLRVVLPEAEKTEIFFDLARKNNIQLRHFYYKRDSLEDLFLKALQGDEKG